MSTVRRAALILGIPLALIGIALGVVFANAGRMPPDVATHWNESGTVDATSSFCASLVPTAMLASIVGAAGLGGLIAFSKNPFALRFVAAFTTGFAVFTATLTIALHAIQWGLPSGTTAPNPSGWVVFGLVAAVACGGLAGYALLPSSRAPLSAEPALWDGVARYSTRARIWFIGTVALVVFTLIVLAFALSQVILIGLAAAVLVVPFALGIGWRVRLDENAVTARALGGWPRISVPISDVTIATPVTTTWGEWGGLGIRARRSGNGLITRGGEAVKIGRADGTYCTITVDGAADLAHLINALVERRRR